jgi:hypothetical protein
MKTLLACCITPYRAVVRHLMRSDSKWPLSYTVVRHCTYKYSPQGRLGLINSLIKFSSC